MAHFYFSILFQVSQCVREIWFAFVWECAKNYTWSELTTCQEFFCWLKIGDSNFWVSLVLPHFLFTSSHYLGSDKFIFSRILANTHFFQCSNSLLHIFIARAILNWIYYLNELLFLKLTLLRYELKSLFRLFIQHVLQIQKEGLTFYYASNTTFFP